MTAPALGRWFVVVGLCFVQACAIANDDKLLFVPPDAKNVRVDKNPNGNQLSYTVDREYPALAWNEANVKGAASAGWQRCAGTDLDNWRAFGDLTTSKPELIHRNSMLLVKADRALVVLAHYFSRLPSEGYSSSTRPDNSKQHVTVIEILKGEKAVAEVRAIYKATCT